MATALTFLKNYEKFGCKIRLITAKTYLEKLLSCQETEIKKVMMLRITEELISSTEDLTMWLTGLEKKESFDNKINNIWDFLLVTKATDNQIISVLKILTRIKTWNGLYKKFKLPPVEYISTFLKIDTKFVEGLFTNLIKVVRTSLKNRTGSRKIMQRFHNKVKHGMIIQDYGNGLYIRDFKLKGTNKRRINRNLYLRMDENKAKKMVGTIEVNLAAINFIIKLFMVDYGYKIDQKKISSKQFTKKELIFLKDSLIDYSTIT